MTAAAGPGEGEGMTTPDSPGPVLEEAAEAFAEAATVFGTGYWLRRDAMQWFWDQYITDPAQRAEVTASPLRASLDELSGLPRALVINGEADVLRDEGEAYAARLRAAGVPVTSVRYNGTIHDFVMLNALRDSNTAKAATAQGGEFLRAVLWDE